MGTVYNRPDIQLNPGPAGYPASVSGSVSENVEMHIIRHTFTQILKEKRSKKGKYRLRKVDK